MEEERVWAHVSHSLTEGVQSHYQSSILLHCRINLGNMLIALGVDFFMFLLV